MYSFLYLVLKAGEVDTALANGSTEDESSKYTPYAETPTVEVGAPKKGQGYGFESQKCQRTPYMEARQGCLWEKREHIAINNVIAQEIAFKCGPEQDDLINCRMDRMWASGKCREYEYIWRRCHYRDKEFLAKRRREVALDRIKSGDSYMFSEMMSQGNKMFDTKDRLTMFTDHLYFEGERGGESLRSW
ncbi:unnamed protein product [Amoebophrya sp. A25]|nr:unnamed protein product [Amoebophrya sp. A25]|eukprot:GSA25T00008935001.1